MTSGIQDGFQIGFNPSLVSLNLHLRTSVIDSYLQNEVSSGRVAGLFQVPLPLSLYMSRFGVIPKNSQPGKWRLILDLSSPEVKVKPSEPRLAHRARAYPGFRSMKRLRVFLLPLDGMLVHRRSLPSTNHEATAPPASPEGQSLNDGIPKPPFTVQYVSVDAFIDGIMTLGRGTLMAKFDVASAYQNVAIQPDVRPLLGMIGVGNILRIWYSHLGCAQHHLSSPPLQTWLNGFWFTIMRSPSSIITWTISSP